MLSHPVRPATGLNVCLGDSQLHNVHHPRDVTVSCPPDDPHIDWVTVPGGTISDLEHAFLVDYARQERPMRILFTGGINDLVQGATVNDMVMRLMHLNNVVDQQNSHHPNVKNELVIATTILPPKLVWFPDYGPAPAHHPNLERQLTELNSWIIYWNELNAKATPRFNRFGVREGKKVLPDGNVVPFKTHRWYQWRMTEPDMDKLHLSDTWRVRMAGAVVKHFRAENERFGTLG